MTDITIPDNEADTVITLKISGNRLVAICNACQALMHQTGKIKYPAYQELDETIERVRDQLSEQRMAKTFGLNWRDRAAYPAEAPAS